MMSTTKKIKGIEFSVLSPEMIRKMSAVEIVRPETYDKDGYPLERGLMDPHLGTISPGLRCKTCGQTMKNCPGHFGSLELVRPVINPKYSDKLIGLLQATCKDCGRLYANPDEINDLLKISSDQSRCQKEIKALTKKYKECPHCGAPVRKVLLDKPTNFYVDQERIYPSEILEWILKIPDTDKFIFGYSEEIKPEWFIMTVLPVSPVAIRPSLSLENVITSEDDLTYKLLDIVRINLRLQDNINAGAPQIIIEDLWDLLQYNITTYIDNETAGVPPTKQRSGKPLKSIAERLKTKKGRFRYNLIGKRVNSAARATITPSLDIKINELGIPQEIAETLTILERATSWNIKRLKDHILNNKVRYIITEKGLRKMVTEENKKELIETFEEGMSIRRNLQDGDLVIFNRQPTLHRISSMGHYVKIYPGKTFRINPMVVAPYNADFDGDEMNMHCPQSEESFVEIKELVSLEKHVINIKDGRPIIVPDDYVVSGSYLLTKNNSEFTKQEVMNILYSIGQTELPTADRGRGNYSGKLIFSQILPKTLNIEYKTKLCKIINQSEKCKKCKKEKCPYDAYFKINNGVLISGHLDSEAANHKSLFETIYRFYGSEELVEIYDKYAKLVLFALQKKGLTISLDEYNASSDLRKEIKQIVKKTITSSNSIIRKYEDKTLPLIPGKDADETFEVEIIKLTAEMKDEISNLILQEKLKDILSETKIKNNNSTLVASIGGSRGRILNVVNMLALWGQHTVRTGRPKTGFSNRVISLSQKGTHQITDYGFVDCNFFDGFPPKEYFFHSIGGRQGEVDTGVATKVSGYLYRRLSNAMKDLIVQDDLAVVGADDKIIQFVYGDDGLSPDKAYLGKNINFFDE
jgi:DNA-directed RNA polymerase subunit A'